MADKESVPVAGSQAPLVSFVTPFYNTGPYLKECIESVLQQTYGNWEYILLNNCSTDESAEIAESYALRYPDRIRLLHNSEHLSQVQNFNRVLRLLSPESKYCKFVQSDDWIFPECVSKMVEIAEGHPEVGIVGAYQLEGNEVSLDGLPYPSPNLSGQDVCRLYFFSSVYLFGTPTSLLLRSEVIRSREPFYEERYAPFEDGHACFDLLKKWNYGFVHQVLTYSRRDNESILLRLRPFNFHRLLPISMLVTHGKDFLSREEFDRCLRTVEREYFVYLARCACSFHGRSKEFWDFHRRGLAVIKYSLNWRLLAKWVPRALVEKMFDTFWQLWDKDSAPRQFPSSER
jgi:glycosyltransferase involved in cell wall biosynthesis